MSKRKLPDLSKKVFPYDLVLGTGKDITMIPRGLINNDIKKSTTAICCTVGWLMKQDSNVTILMSDFNFENEKELNKVVDIQPYQLKIF